ncbi:MAG: recombinase family protein [Peptoclostridium sp.]|uniref:recombinase family protein n=1 Tax=Peptoclostridium sp. TaxID=1904860 RepID=UPI00139E1473|nr:recombinase family protein [Peptoclostridium sp.]MZQ74727.1 recombinase family protein [Peptoclostridium sp.]
MKKVVIYARVSTAEQAEEGYSIDAQLDTVKKKCEQEGRVVVNEYVDRGISGKSIEKRDALKKLLKDAAKGQFEEVWVWKTNRLARNHLDLLKIVDELNKNNVGFKSCSEVFDTSTPTGKLMMNLLASVGEFERETIVENVKLGMKQRAKMGKWNGGVVLGYKSVKSGDDKEKSRLVIVEEEAETVRMIFQLYASGRGLKSIVNHINKLGYRSKKGNMFAIATIKEILHNPVYIGKIRYNRMQDWNEKRRKGRNENPMIVDGEHTPIIEIDLWNKVHRLYKERSHKPVRNFSGSYPLTGILKCPQCGASMVAGVVKRKLKNGNYSIHRYYYCGRWRNQGIAACHSNGIRKDYVEEIVFNKINEVLFNEQVLSDIVFNLNKRSSDIIEPLDNHIKKTEKVIRELESKKARIFELYEEGIISKCDISDRLKEIMQKIDVERQKIEEAEKQLSQSTSDPIEYEVVKRLMLNFNYILKEADIEKKKLVLNLVIREIKTNPDRTVKSILLNFNNKTNQYLGNSEDESNDDSSSFCLEINLCMDKP